MWLQGMLSSEAPLHVTAFLKCCRLNAAGRVLIQSLRHSVQEYAQQPFRLQTKQKGQSQAVFDFSAIVPGRGAMLQNPTGLSAGLAGHVPLS